MMDMTRQLVGRFDGGHVSSFGEAEKRIKECQLDLFGRRLSTTAFRANQLRLWLAAIACAFKPQAARRPLRT